MDNFTVSQECISCNACVGVAVDNFELGEDRKAFLKKQPETEQELALCNKALSVCPVEAISIDNKVKDIPDKPIVGSDNVKKTLDKYPGLKPILADLSPKFKRMQNPALYNTLARFASFNDAAKVTGVSICEILHAINRYLGTEDKLASSMPGCIGEKGGSVLDKSVAIDWNETNDRFICNSETVGSMVEMITKLEPQESIVIITTDSPFEIAKVAEGLGFIFNIEEGRDSRISIYNPNELKNVSPWKERVDEFETLDVRSMTTDPFDIIIKKAYEIEEDYGFALIQSFEPLPMINMLSEMGYEHFTSQQDDGSFKVFFHKLPTVYSEDEEVTDKVSAVIQSATPVAYPVIMKLLQSEKIRKAINIKELKVWEETEKHLAWITNGKADITFSALITSAKLRGHDIKIPALFVWDNFVILSREKAEGFKELMGKQIHTPLFEEAPPAKITKYLMKASGFNPNDFDFVYGKPFGRPEEIFKSFVRREADVVILREPEASYAIKILEDRREDFSIISYNELWNEINRGFGSFPNAGIALKGEFVRENPEVSRVLLDELKDAIEWVNSHRSEAAKLSFDMMRQPTDRVEKFLERVNFEYVEGDKLKEKVKDYFDILNREGIVDLKVDDEFLKTFEL